MKVRSFVALIARNRRPDDLTTPAVNARDWLTWRQDGLALWYAPRESVLDTNSPGSTLPELVLGDASEWKAGEGDASLAGGATVRYDASARALVVCTSIVALPPVFLYQGPDAVAVTSDISLLKGLPGVHLEFDPRGVTELGRFGQPVEHRTMFRDLGLVAAGGRLAIGLDGRSSFDRIWQLPESAPVSWPEFIEAQIGAFDSAVRDMDVSRSFLSLTAGLDTRTVFSALASTRRLVPGVTMTGAHSSLDARTAGKLCRAYGVEHQLVVLDEAFVRDLPRLVERASTLSGGLSSLGQAPEVFLYDEAGSGRSARLSGNLGNQVGRGGTEGVSIRGADLAVLGAQLRVELPDEHWLLRRLNSPPHEALEFILQNEMAYTSVGNYSIGNHYATQQSPYATRALIETLSKRPARAGNAPRSKLRMRLRDLKHRFLGEEERVSFQRALVKRIGGPASRIPINWGWRASGGVAPVGLVLGAATLAGMAARATGFDDGMFGPLLRRTGLPSLHDFRESRRWLRVNLRDYVMDTLTAQVVRDAGLFDARRLSAVLDSHFRGQSDHYETVTFALDVALANRMLRA
jgi:hypothetical protein